MLQLHMLPSSPVSSPNPRLLCFRDSSSSPPLPLRGHSTLNPRKASRVSLARAPDGHFSLKCRQSEYFDQQQRFASSTSSDNSTSFSPSGGGTMSPKVFVGHSIYKGKAALTVEPRAPEFTSLDSGAYKLSREGFVLLQFAPAAGTRVYDWSRKQVFSLSVTEIGNLIALGPRDSCEFFHDPFKGKSDEGKIRKVLKVEPLPDGSGHFFNLSVQNKLMNLDESIYIPVTKAEYTVLISAFNFILPYLLGWHAYANTIKPNDPNRANNANSRYGGDFEWSR
ncbi:single-stranded DNA-binding protein WHY1, chloroplastic-like isoform X2 [Rhodamnia argentea]|uniref:Single-stranded DNA-binding protein WHY1, chloroplastic-like isoform X2 n=1 Tax=Rhodamnia argentea TaxID=178133 RepID=A0A8B8QCB9_9MYRT|nr:single-stranded DNA-binding protein WHY1, chloroplastic-like isoform X2 [Rhodamnia argentea]